VKYEDILMTSLNDSHGTTVEAQSL